MTNDLRKDTTLIVVFRQQQYVRLNSEGFSTIFKKYKLIIAFFSFISLFGVTSCKKLVESPPPTDIVAETNVYSVDAAAISVLNGIYIGMSGGSFQGRFSISLFAGLSADEITLSSVKTGSSYVDYYQNSLSVINGTGSDVWSPLFKNIFKCNAAIEGLTSEKSSGLTPAIRQQLLGEARFMRAFFYFYLVNLFGDLPLVITTDPEVNTSLARSSQGDVYQQIITDLLQAKELLNANFLDGTLLNSTTERIRPTKWAAIALLARVYLYTGEYAKAEEEASAVIANKSLFGNSLPLLKDVFLKNSQEAIWQIQPTDANFNTTEAQTLILDASGPNDYSNPVYLSNTLLNSFEPGDQREVNGNWINSVKIGAATYRFPFKYKLNLYDPSITSYSGTANMQEYFMVLRLGEQYLIRAEARGQQGNLIGADDDLNLIRTRANLGPLAPADKDGLLLAILHERQVELFMEWGHRWLDLKRTGKVNEVMTKVTPLKANGAPWKTYQQFYPLPKASDLDKAPNLHQNPGYEN